MNIIQVIILGIIEGITEFLPISSTGHMIIASYVLGIAQTDTVKSFEIAIQCGAIVSVVVMFWKKVITDWKLIKKIILACIPTMIIGLAAYSFVKQHLLGSVEIVAIALGVGGVIMIGAEYIYKYRKQGNADEKISYTQAVASGFFQSIAMIPGVSRSAATIIGGLMMGMERKTIVMFSFLIAIPTMAGATALDIYKSQEMMSIADLPIFALGFVIAGIVAYVSIKWLLRFVEKHSFVWFGVYRIIVAIILLLIIKWT